MAMIKNISNKFEIKKSPKFIKNQDHIPIQIFI